MEHLISGVRAALSKINPSLRFLEQEPTDPFGWTRSFTPDKESLETAIENHAGAIASSMSGNSDAVWISSLEPAGSDVVTFLAKWPLSQ
jgi:hypothetical protein